MAANLHPIYVDFFLQEITHTCMIVYTCSHCALTTHWTIYEFVVKKSLTNILKYPKELFNGITPIRRKNLALVLPNLVNYCSTFIALEPLEKRTDEIKNII